MTKPNSDDLKGRAKEALGALTDDDDMKREGRNDQTAGKAKNAIEGAADKAREGVDKVREKLNRD